MKGQTMKTDDGTRRIWVLDTTLRDGTQSPGAALSPREKGRAARQLERLGVDAVEAGFPAASPSEADGVERVVASTERVAVGALARCVAGDVAAAGKSLSGAGKRGTIHVFLGTSAWQRKWKLRRGEKAILRLIREMVGLAREKSPGGVRFSPEDAMRTERAFLAEAVGTALEAGATEINIPDTVGWAMPGDFSELVPWLRGQVPGLEAVRLTVHTHNDLGLATANSLAALAAGADGVEGTVNGIGERAGNCALEEVAMALAVRAELGMRTGIRTEEITPTSRLLNRLTGLPVAAGKPIVGANAFVHGAGVHQDGVLKCRETYEIFPPESVGRREGSELTLGRHSGRAGFVDHLVRLGVNVESGKLEELYAAFMELADKKKQVYDDDLLELAKEHLSETPKAWRLATVQVTAGNRTIPTATVQLERDGGGGRDSATGGGPVDAVFRAIDRITGKPGELRSFSIQALSRGQDALGEVSILADFGGGTLGAKGSDTDIVVASAKAYLNALNRHLAQGRAARGRRRQRSGL